MLNQIPKPNTLIIIPKNYSAIFPKTNLSPAWLSLSASLTFICPRDNSRFFLFSYSRIKIAFFFLVVP